MQQRAETLDDALIRELLELRAERAHLHKISSLAQVQEQCDGEGEEPGVVTSAAKVNRCSGDKLATAYACFAASLSLHILPWHILFLAQSKCTLRGRISVTSVTVPRWRRSAMVRLRSMSLLLRQPKHTGVFESNSPPLMPAMPLLLSSSAVLTPVSILRTTKTVFPQHALVVSYFKLSQV